MDISELIKHYTPNQKNAFVAACIILPVVFTVMYFYIPAFSNFEFYLQSIFAACCSILVTFFSIIVLSITAIMGNAKLRSDVLIIILPSVVSAMFLLVSPDDYNSGYDYIITKFLRYSVILYVPIAVFGFIMHKAKQWDKKKNRQDEDKSDHS